MGSFAQAARKRLTKPRERLRVFVVLCQRWHCITLVCGILSLQFPSGFPSRILRFLLSLHKPKALRQRSGGPNAEIFTFQSFWCVFSSWVWIAARPVNTPCNADWLGKSSISCRSQGSQKGKHHFLDAHNFGTSSRLI